MELATEQITSLETSDIVLAYLAKEGASETPDIAFSTGISPRDISLAIHELKKCNYVTTIKITDGRTGIEVTRHELLETAERLTAVMQAHKEKKAAQRRFLAPNRPKLAKERNNGQRHIHGMPGKIDLTKIPNGIRGKVYMATEKPGLRGEQLAEKAGVGKQQVWNVLTDLVKFGYVAFKEEKQPHCGKKVRVYHRLIDIRNPSITSPDDIPYERHSPKNQKAKEPAAPKAEEMKPDVMAPTSLDSIKNYVDQQLGEELDVDALLEKLDASDVLLAAAVKIAEENKKLRELLKANL